jgi:hypothetical protein
MSRNKKIKKTKDNTYSKLTSTTGYSTVRALFYVATPCGEFWIITKL